MGVSENSLDACTKYCIGFVMGKQILSQSHSMIVLIYSFRHVSFKFTLVPNFWKFFENWICNNAKFHSRRKSFQACKLLQGFSVNAFLFCRSAVIFYSDYRAGKLCSCYIYIHYGLWSSIVQLKTAEIQLLKALPREMPMSHFYTQSTFVPFKTYVHKQFLLDHVMQVKTGSYLPVLHISAMYAFVDKIIWAQRDVMKKV